jgi:CRP/FNR family transcriptional regulator, anaerobic regulatory protein
MTKLLQYLENIHPLTDGLRDELHRIVTAAKIKKKGYLLKSGRVCNNIYFIEEGLLRCYYIKNQTEVCSWFMKEGDIAISIKSFFEQTSSYENIQALEDTLVYYISYDDLQLIYRQYPEFNFIGRVLTERYYTLSEQRLFGMRLQRSSERYQYLIQQSPDLIKRVPAIYIASLLGITLETLSRIKSRR